MGQCKKFYEACRLEGIWELLIKFIKKDDLYKFSIETINKGIILKSDSFAYHFEIRPETESKFYNISDYVWNDEDLIAYKKHSIDKFEGNNCYEYSEYMTS